MIAPHRRTKLCRISTAVPGGLWVIFGLVEHDGVTVDRERCIRCAACSTLVPAVFTLREGPVTLLRQPESQLERDRCAAALLICPSQAIGVQK